MQRGKEKFSNFYKQKQNGLPPAKEEDRAASAELFARILGCAKQGGLCLDWANNHAGGHAMMAKIVCLFYLSASLLPALLHQCEQIHGWWSQVERWAWVCASVQSELLENNFFKIKSKDKIKN